MKRGVTREMVQRAKELSDEKLSETQREQIRQNMRDAQPMVDELAAAGLDIEEPGDLPFARQADKKQYRHVAVPILTRWLPSMKNQDIRMAIARALAVPEARPVAIRPLLDAFKREKCEGRDFYVKDAIGAALSVVADDSVFDELVLLIRDEGQGQCRQPLLWALGNMKRPEAAGVLLEVLNGGDELLAPWAIRPLGKFRVKAARKPLRALLDSSSAWARQEARSALKKIDKAR